MPTPEERVLAANEAFYRAFSARDLAAMERVWASAAEIACIHPGWPLLDGRELVLGSWRAIMQNPASPRVRCAEAQAQICGAMAWVVCHEVLTGGERLIATNIFALEAEAWRLVHHHAGPVAAAFDEGPGNDEPPLMN